MAQGTLEVFDEFALHIGTNAHNLGTDAFSVMLVNNTLVPTIELATPDSSDFTEVTGTNYTAGGIALLTPTWTHLSGVGTFDDTNLKVLWTQAAGGPSDVYYAIIYNTTHAGTTDAVAFIDLTPDSGSTPISLIDGDIDITWGGLGVFKTTT